MLNVKRLLFACVLFIFATSSKAQEGLELGGWAGISYYFGDLNTDFYLGSPGLAAGISGRYNFNDRLCIKLGANYGNISGDDANSQNTFQQTRNLSFKSVVFDGTAQFEFNFLPYVHGSKDQYYTPYLFTGISTYYFNPKANFDGEWVELRPLGTEGQFRGDEYYSIRGAVAFGGGFKIDLNYEWSINVEISTRKLFNDYLDDVSGNYPDLDDLESLRGPLSVSLSDRSVEVDGIDAPIGQVGRQRGNINDNDKYTFIGVGLMYYFGDLRCPTYSR